MITNNHSWSHRPCPNGNFARRALPVPARQNSDQTLSLQSGTSLAFPGGIIDPTIDAFIHAFRAICGELLFPCLIDPPTDRDRTIHRSHLSQLLDFPVFPGFSRETDFFLPVPLPPVAANNRFPLRPHQTAKSTFIRLSDNDQITESFNHSTSS